MLYLTYALYQSFFIIIYPAPFGEFFITTIMIITYFPDAIIKTTTIKTPCLNSSSTVTKPSVQRVPSGALFSCNNYDNNLFLQ